MLGDEEGQNASKILEIQSKNKSFSVLVSIPLFFSYFPCV